MSLLLALGLALLGLLLVAGVEWLAERGQSAPKAPGIAEAVE